MEWTVEVAECSLRPLPSPSPRLSQSEESRVESLLAEMRGPSMATSLSLPRPPSLPSPHLALPPYPAPPPYSSLLQHKLYSFEPFFAPPTYYGDCSSPENEEAPPLPKVPAPPLPILTSPILVSAQKTSPSWTFCTSSASSRSSESSSEYLSIGEMAPPPLLRPLLPSHSNQAVRKRFAYIEVARLREEPPGYDDGGRGKNWRQHSDESGVGDSSEGSPRQGIETRGSARQASFMAAVAGGSHNNVIAASPEEESSPMGVNIYLAEERLVRRPRHSTRPITLHGDSSLAACLVSETLSSQQSPVYAWSREGSAASSEGCMAVPSMRRQRPKSYVLATSSSFPVGEADRILRGRSPPLRNNASSSLESEDYHQSADCLSSPRPANTQRLHKFIALFSHNHDNNNKAPPSRGAVKRSRTAVGRERNRLGGRERLPLPPVPAACVAKQGPLLHQELALGVSSASWRKGGGGGVAQPWQQCWAVLSGQQVFLCNQLSSYVAGSSSDKMLSIPCDAVVVDVAASLTDIAYDCLRSGRRHAFRVVSQKRTEHLLQAASEEEMLEWIERIQAASSSQKENRIGAFILQESSAEPGERGTVQYSQSSLSSLSSPSLPSSSTTQLIMHRYKAKASQLGSPLSSKRASGESTATAASASASSSSRVAPAPSTSQTTSECNGASGEVGGTPKSGRRWKRGKAGKEGSGSQSSADRPPPSSAFGSKITDCATGGDGDVVPLLVQVCVRVVEAHGMDTVGIYRIPGNTAAVNALKEALNDGFDHIDFSDARWKDVNVVSSLLKMFLRKLPEPLLTDKLYPFFIDANRIAAHHSRLHKLRNLLRKLPRPHYMTLKFIIGHLSAVTKHSDVNKMETRNLALMFGPSIVRPSDDSMATMVTHMSDQCKIIETFVNYFDWIFDEAGTAEDAVPCQLPGDSAPLPHHAGSHCLDNPPPGVSSSSFNDMHSLIIRANEEQAVAMMKENDKGKIKSILNVRRNSRRDKSKGKLKIESTAPAAMNPLHSSLTAASSAPSTAQAPPPPPSYRVPISSTPTQSSVDSAFCGNYQERDIDAEIASRGGGGERGGGTPSLPSLAHSPSLESSLGSMPDTGRSEGSEASERRRRVQNMSSARRIFIAGSEEAAAAAADSTAMEALTSHTQHLHLAASPALEVYSAETRDKIRRMQLLGTAAWRQHDKVTPSPTKEDALSFTSDYSTTSSAPASQAIGVLVHSEGGGVSSEYASSEVSPCARNASASPRVAPPPSMPRPQQLLISPSTSQQNPASKVVTRVTRLHRRDPARRHTLSDVHALREDRDSVAVESRDARPTSSRLPKLARWLKIGIRKSSPDVRMSPPLSLSSANQSESPISPTPRDVTPPAIVRTSPNELTPASGDEQL